MSEKIRVGIVGYGNLAKGTEYAVEVASDMELVAVFTRRDPASITTRTGVPVYSTDSAADFVGKIDVMIICGGSATDLPKQTPELSKLFNTVDSFDTHAEISNHFAKCDKASKEASKISVISVGWDPGMFSINRIYAESALSNGKTYTFWGKGVSQGHSDAIRRVEGVLDGKQYTIPVPSALDAVRSGSNPEFTTREKHTRECFVVAAEGADKDKITKTICEMPNYFDEYDTVVNFITAEELARDHSKIAHGGFVIHAGETGDGNKHIIEYSLKLDSNPEFTSSVLASYARAAVRMNKAGDCGCKTAFDVAPGLLSEKSAEVLRATML